MDQKHIERLYIDNSQTKSQHIINTDIPILSFFTGAGFLDIGFAQMGFHSIWRNEYNKFFIHGFEYGMKALMGDNYDNRIHNTSSIIDIGPNQINREAFGAQNRPKIFGIIGGPPCPDFSVGGKNKGKEGNNGKLSQIFVNRIIELQPTFFLFENVPGLLRTDKHRLFFESIVKQISLDYCVDYKILNALDFGAPQDRERVFFVGIHKKWVRKHHKTNEYTMKSNWFPWPVDIRFIDAKSRYKWPTCGTFGDFQQKPMNIPDELMIGTYINDVDELKLMPNGMDIFNPKSVKFTLIDEGDVSRKSFKRLHRWRYSPTAAYGNNEVHLHPFLPRRLSVREALRIQTVPDMYSLPPTMPLSHKFKTIGNGVPIKLANAIASSFRNLFVEE